MSRLPGTIDELKLFKDLHSADEKQFVSTLTNITNLGSLRDDKIGNILHAITAKDGKETKDMPAKIRHLVDKLHAEGTVFNVLDTFYSSSSGGPSENPLQTEIKNGGDILLSTLANHTAFATGDNLEKLKASLQKLNNNSRSAVDYSFLCGNRSTVETLKKLKVPFKTREGAPLITASYIKNQPDRQMFLIHLLVNHPDIKDQINYQGVRGNTAIHRFIRRRDDVSVGILLTHGADPSIPDNSYYLRTGKGRNCYEFAESLKRNANDTRYDAVVSVLRPHKDTLNPHIKPPTGLLSRVGLFVTRKGNELLQSISETFRDVDGFDGFGGLYP